jgi:hypothetical protein
MKEVSVLDMNSTKELSSLAQFPTVCPHTSFCLSPEAFILFKPVDSETVVEAIKNQIELLGEANKSDFGYTELIENINDYNLTDVGTYQIFSLRQKCTYLALALTLAKDNMNQWTWKKCCEEAIAMPQKSGMRQTSNPQSVMEWYRKFRTRQRFTMPCKKNQLPPFLEHNQDITKSIKQYCKEHLGELSVDTILPNLVREINGSSREELGEQKYLEVLKQVLKPFRLTCISISTVSRWMNLLGFKYELRWKGYLSKQK